MKIGIAIRENQSDYFVHKSYVYLIKKYGFEFDYVSLNTNLYSFDAFLLPGGYDIDPAYYHQSNYASSNISFEIDELDKKIILFCVQNKTPLLGICRGIQSINVFLGGSLKQNIINHMDENHFIYFNNNYILVNSFHHQSIDRLADS